MNKYILFIAILFNLSSCTKYYEKKDEQKLRAQKENCIDIQINNGTIDSIKNLRIYIDNGYLTDSTDLLLNEMILLDIPPGSSYSFTYNCKGYLSSLSQGFCLKYNMFLKNKIIYTTGISNAKIIPKTLNFEFPFDENPGVVFYHWKY
jgi:hypothetical protein